MEEISLEDVAKRNGRDGTVWTALWNNVYDITEFTPRHPGGFLVQLAAGRDATSLVESYHFASLEKVKAWLPKLKIVGRLKDAPSLPDDRFYVTLKERVSAHLKAKHLSPYHLGWMLQVESVLVSLVYVALLSYTIAYNSFLAAAMLGLVIGRMGFLMHCGNHGSVSKNPAINWLVGFLLDFAGANSTVWRFDHQVAHHLNPNQLDSDNDCQIADPLLRMHPELARKWWHSFQVATTLVGMSTGFLSWFLRDAFHLAAGAVGKVSFCASPMQFWGCVALKSLWIVLNVIVPLRYHSLGAILLRIAISMVVGAHYLENTFIVNHIQDGLVPPSKALHWAEKQAYGSANWASRSHVWNWVTAGLNHQIEHHLFPSLSIFLYPEVTPIVEQTCKEFNVPWKNYPSWTKAWLSTMGYLANLGKPEHIHSL